MVDPAGLFAAAQAAAPGISGLLLLATSAAAKAIAGKLAVALGLKGLNIAMGTAEARVISRALAKAAAAVLRAHENLDPLWLANVFQKGPVADEIARVLETPLESIDVAHAERAMLDAGFDVGTMGFRLEDLLQSAREEFVEE